MVIDVADNNSDEPDTVVDCEATAEMKDILDKLKILMRKPSLSNDDVSVMVNGLSKEPICGSPFFSTFTKQKNTQLLSPCWLCTIYKGMSCKSIHQTRT